MRVEGGGSAQWTSELKTRLKARAPFLTCELTMLSTEDKVYTGWARNFSITSLGQWR